MLAHAALSTSIPRQHTSTQRIFGSSIKIFRVIVDSMDLSSREYSNKDVSKEVEGINISLDLSSRKFVFTRGSARTISMLNRVPATFSTTHAKPNDLALILHEQISADIKRTGRKRASSHCHRIRLEKHYITNPREKEATLRETHPCMRLCVHRDTRQRQDPGGLRVAASRCLCFAKAMPTAK